MILRHSRLESQAFSSFFALSLILPLIDADPSHAGETISNRDYLALEAAIPKRMPSQKADFLDSMPEGNARFNEGTTLP